MAGEGRWTADDTVRLAAELKTHGVDLLDVSTGGDASGVRIPVGADYQVPVAAVGLITEAEQAEQAERILANGETDAVLLGRELLRTPSWARQTARELGGEAHVPEAVPPVGPAGARTTGRAGQLRRSRRAGTASARVR